MHARVEGRPAAGPWAVALLLAAVYLPTLVWLVERWSMGVWYHLHGFVVFPVALWLAWGRLRARPGRPEDPSAWGFLFLVPAVALQMVDAALGFEILSAVSLVLALPGLCLLLLGKERTRALWFPLCFLVFAVPIPLFAVRPVHLALRQIAAVGTEAVLDLLGYAVVREGTLLQVGPESIQIADACSGFSTLTALFMVGLLLPYLARARWWRGALLVALVFPFAALANIARCVVLSMLVVAFTGDVLGTIAHPLSGVATFVVALLLLLQAERLLIPGART